jgi:hypothetical protein
MQHVQFVKQLHLRFVTGNDELRQFCGGKSRERSQQQNGEEAFQHGTRRIVTMGDA